MSNTLTNHRPEKIFLGIVLILISTLLTSLQDVIFKYTSSDLTLWQLYVLRSLLLIPPLLLMVAMATDKPTSWRHSLHFWPMARSILFILMYFSIYAPITVLPLSIIAAGIYTAPLFVAALSALLVNEPVKPMAWLAIAVGFIGVLIILQPGTDAFNWVALLPVSGGLFYALSALITRSKCQTVLPASLALSLSIVLLVTGAVISAALYIWQPMSEQVEASPFLLGSWAYLDLSQWGFVLLLALLMLGNGLVLPKAYQSAPPVIIATFDYCYLIFASLFGFIIFAEVPTLSTIVGMVMIAGAGAMVARA